MDAFSLLINKIKAFIARMKEMYLYVFFNYLPDEETQENNKGFDFFW